MWSYHYIYDKKKNLYIGLGRSGLEFKSDPNDTRSYSYKAEAIDELIKWAGLNYMNIDPEIHKLQFKWSGVKNTVEHKTIIPVKNWANFPFLGVVHFAISKRKTLRSWQAHWAAMNVTRQLAEKSNFGSMTHLLVLPEGTGTQFQFLKDCGFKRSQYYICKSDNQYYIFLSSSDQMTMAKLGLEIKELIELA
jgi:hypothetical protein